MMKSEITFYTNTDSKLLFTTSDAAKKSLYQTVCSYKDTFRLYFRYLEDIHGISATNISIKHFELKYLQRFCKYLEEKRKNKPVTINNRIAAIKSFMQYVAETAPEYSAIANKCLCCL